MTPENHAPRDYMQDQFDPFKWLVICLVLLLCWGGVASAMWLGQRQIEKDYACEQVSNMKVVEVVKAPNGEVRCVYIKDVQPWLARYSAPEVRK